MSAVRKLHGLNDEEIGQFLEGVQRAALIVGLPAERPPRVVPDDEDDDYVVATAVQGKADVLCTRDRDLYHQEVLDYCAVRHIEVIDDAERLRRLRDTEAEDE